MRNARTIKQTSASFERFGVGTWFRAKLKGIDKRQLKEWQGVVLARGLWHSARYKLFSIVIVKVKLECWEDERGVEIGVQLVDLSCLELLISRGIEAVRE